jgi:hypothetical protein
MHTRFPKYLARPSDGTVFSLNKDEKTYSIKEHKDKNPFNLHHEYNFSHLISLDFYEVQESDFPTLKKFGKEYYEFISWTSRSDGHGGCKGGTFQEFKLMKERKTQISDLVEELQFDANIEAPTNPFEVEYVHPGQRKGESEKTFKLRRVLQEAQQLADAGCYYGKTEEDFTKRLTEIKELISKNL